VTLVVKPLVVGVEIVDEYLRWLGDNGQVPEPALARLLPKTEQTMTLLRAGDRAAARPAVLALLEELERAITGGDVGLWEGRSMQGLLRRVQWVLETP
jgi:hypothetical protein